ncbi:hypothetical protein BDV35DRAFT_386970 [Aspergillus flavus]|uniref:DNA, SC011 n=3 Tax=Aspergillus subgen. Circumdati TaxID=2720871 RepID=Q2U1J1_ASPOR|nr:unnamed protein product [Aspergillus oryzae RIB40]EIT74447.1 hypothetical protein Ao3042_09507 [Aspergillus oryzae 3.042]KAB8252921.1 hypothetical protein BDV35DRAFT_386970 [Aspergillus flavus]KDE77988.1 hypothetical protein AO1008_03916 [Aspergillus oryzae 100-8]BAE64574.1 unnamed protein product [Aspergillus oryzae RIB40]|eukprot:EIT74447.1 hypothetical protein Ao3042_09507 [Aspergillus oryzae 3.042]
MQSLITLLALPASTLAGSVLWSGISDSSLTVDDIDKWSWSNQVGAWQWYIHGSGKTSEYLGISPEFKNPAAADAQGLRITIDGTSFWNGQTMERSELIPQTKADLGSGHLYYHFSLSTKETNAPNPSFEHQIAFFESHFTELKYGASGSSDNTLSWNADGKSHWSVQLEAGTWYNFAYDIDFDSKKVGLWASNGSEPLTQVVEPVSASTSTNSADWHVGQLRLPGSESDDAAEDWFWSGVYIEEGPITTEIGSESSSGSSSSAGPSSTTIATTAPASSTAHSATSTGGITATVSSVGLTTTATPSPVSTAVSSSVTPSSLNAAPTKSTEVATPTSSSVATFASPTSAAEFLTDIRALLKTLLSRSEAGSVHARDFIRRG